MTMEKNLEAARIKWLSRLRWASMFVLLTGLFPTLAISESTEEPWRLFFDFLRWPIDQNPASFSESDRQLSAVLGGVLCAWAWILYKLADPEIFNEKIRRTMLQSVVVWFILDSGGSIFSGLPLNAMTNLGFLLILLVPLHFLKES